MTLRMINIKIKKPRITIDMKKDSARKEVNPVFATSFAIKQKTANGSSFIRSDVM